MWNNSYETPYESWQKTPDFKASILKCSSFFMVQLSHPYRTTGKTTALTRWIFVDKVKLDGNEIPSAQLDGDEEMK